MGDFMHPDGQSMFQFGRPNWLVPDEDWDDFCEEARRETAGQDITRYSTSVQQAVKGERCVKYRQREDQLLTPADFYAPKVAYLKRMRR